MEPREAVVRITRRLNIDGPDDLVLSWDDPHKTGRALITREALSQLVDDLNETRAALWECRAMDRMGAR